MSKPKTWMDLLNLPADRKVWTVDELIARDEAGLPDAERQGASGVNAALHREEEAGE